MRFTTSVVTKGYRLVYDDIRRSRHLLMSPCLSIVTNAAMSSSSNANPISSDQSQEKEQRAKAKRDWEQNNVRKIRMNVCASLYTDWYDRGISRKKPLTGVEYDVVYADTWPGAPSHIPVVLGLHGTASSHLYFSSMAAFMATRGIRFIVPNFPGCGFTQMDKEWVFEHSPRERACFVTDLLDEIGVSKVSVVVAHSAAVYPAMILSKSPDAFCSVAIVNPGWHHYKWVTKNAGLYAVVLKLIDLGIPLRSVAYKLIKRYANKLPGGQHGAEKFEVGTRSMIFNDFDEINMWYMQLKLQNVPMILAYSNNDKVFPQEMNEELANHLEINRANMFLYDDDAKLKQTGKVISNGRYAHAIVFNKGGHAILNIHSNVIEKAVFDLLSYVRERTISKL